MSPHAPSRLARFSCRIAVCSAVLAIGATFARAELLIEHERGGLDRWTSVGGPVAGGFTLFEPTRIEGVTAWMSAIGPIGVGLKSDSPDGVYYSEEFTGSFTPGLPGKWQGVMGLKWDLQPGTYFVAFSDGGFPIGYGGPASTAPQGFETFMTQDRWAPPGADWQGIGFPIGMRVYGNLLSAVPEPSTYGAVAGLALLGLIVIRRRSSAPRADTAT